MNPQMPNKAAFDAARSIGNFVSTRFPCPEAPVCELLDIPWFAERVQQAIDESTAHMLRKINLLHDATIVLRNCLGGHAHWDDTGGAGSGCPICISQREAKAEAIRLIGEAVDT